MMDTIIIRNGNYLELKLTLTNVLKIFSFATFVECIKEYTIFHGIETGRNHYLLFNNFKKNSKTLIYNKIYV